MIKTTSIQIEEKISVQISARCHALDAQLDPNDPMATIRLMHQAGIDFLACAFVVERLKGALPIPLDLASQIATEIVRMENALGEPA